ncbi:MAG: WYL domain-containing protein [Eubacteriales bacterium]|nr:WYL domain-containing protein [Eubacteriales bacterium]
MSNKERGLRRMLQIKDILWRRSDNQHKINLDIITNALEIAGFTADPRTVRNDIRRLNKQEECIQITREGKEDKFCYIDEKREFTLAELRMLVDCIQSSRFITTQQSTSLINKLKKQTSDNCASDIQKQVIIFKRVKSPKNHVFESIGIIHQAIIQNKKIAFRYWKWNVHKSKTYHNDNQEYVLSPYLLEYRDDYYYLIGYEKKSDKVKTFRIDKLVEVRLMEEDRDKNDKTAVLHPEIYSKKQIHMFGGEEMKVRLRGKNDIVGVIIDQYGSENIIVPEENNYFSVSVNVEISEQFYGWVAGLGDNITIIHPEEAVDGFRNHIDKIRNLYTTI